MSERPRFNPIILIMFLVVLLAAWLVYSIGGAM